MFPYALCGVCLLIAAGFGLWAFSIRTRQAALLTRQAELERNLSAKDAQLQRFAPILDVVAQSESLQRDLAAERQRGEAQRESAQSAIDALALTRATLEREITALQAELARLDERAMFVDHGLYQNVFDFVTSDRYRTELERTRERQKSMVKDKQAGVCAIEWTVEGSKAKGAKMVGDTLKLMLRAFNGECDAAVLKVRYNNVHALVNRVETAFAKINKLGAVNRCEITQAFLRYKLDELRLTHEYQEKLEEEREAQRQVKEQMREEAKIAKEIEKAQRDAEREEAKLEQLLAKAREQADAAVGARHEQMLGKIEELQRQLAEASALKQRVRARAESTRAGHVYVISNIGSFGDGVYKIGMTRRLDPNDRVRELGDASVPFRFDVHAMISTDDAPGLESRLHAMFGHRRVNRVNHRKEFFAVELEEIQAAVAKQHGVFQFIPVPDAEEYRQSLIIRAQG